MKKLVPIAAALLTLSSSLLKAAPMGKPDAQDFLIIGSESRCLQSSGVPIEEVPDNQVKLACLKDPTVQSTCNPDGSHARVNAFRSWTAQVMDFKERCTEVGGTFSFADPNFKEPADSSFCSLAQPEVMYSEWETPMCNFVSRCPQVAVSCIHNEEAIQGTLRTVLLPGVPNAINIAH